MPETQPSKYKQEKQKERPQSDVKTILEFKWQGLTAIIRDKKEFVLIKLMQLTLQKTSHLNKKELKVTLGDFQVIQDDFELVMKHHGAQNLLENLDDIEEMAAD